MRLNKFLLELSEAGEVTVDRKLEISAEELDACIPILKSLEKSARLNAPSGLPKFNEKTASTALKIFYNICQMMVNRDFSENLINNTFNQLEELPDPASLETVWSVDVVFRYLPDIFRMSTKLSKGDPLCDKIVDLAKRFPFSTPGIKIDDCVDAYLVENDALKIIYMNRIIESEAVDRLVNADTKLAIEEKLGNQQQLCQNLMEKSEREISA